ncbi:MAG TPA: NAD-dependent dehydratase, partial [Thermoplasmata archaeon]|nr:NAD-dependent dehydratase [Thermoplasmata archaeon]
PTGRLVLDFLNGRMVGYVDTALNVVDVDDVAAGQLLAAERGELGRSYILGGENLELRSILSLLGERTGLKAPVRPVPRGVVLGAAWVSEFLEGRVLRRTPTVPLDGARMAMTRMVFSDERARRELGYTSRPAADALERSARWFVDHGYVSARRRPLVEFSS